MGKPSESGHCKFPELCDKSGQCEYWLRHNEGCAVVAMREAEKKPQSGKTLADFAGSDEAFKRPQHGFPYAFDGSRHLKEIINGKTFWPRLTAEDLTATDWEEVK